MLKELQQRLFKSTPSNWRSVISFDGGGINMLVGQSTQQAIDLKHYLYRRCANQEQAQKDTLATLAQEYQLHTMPCSFVLQPRDYQLLLMEAPDVPVEELGAAAKWCFKDKLEFPMEDALIDAFPIPNIGTAKQRHMMYVIVARLSKLKPKLNLFEECNITIDSIHIPELCIHDLFQQAVKTHDEMACLYLLPHFSGLLINQKQNLVMARGLPFSFINLNEEQWLPRTNFQEPDLKTNYVADLLVCELHRSFDYYHAQMGQSIPECIYLSAPPFKQNEIIPFLQKKIDCDVEFLDLNDCLLQGNQILTHEQWQQSMPIMGALVASLEVK